MKKIILILLLPVITFAQQTISGTFSPANDYKYAFLYHSKPLKTEFVARGIVDSLGNFSIEMDTVAPKGLYKLVYAMPPEENNFNLIYNGQENIEIKYSEERGLVFEESNENKLWASYTNSLEMVNSTISNFYSKGGHDKKAFKDIFKTLSDTQNAYESNSENLIVNKMIKANRPYLPIAFEDVSTYAKNLRITYLDNIDFNDPLLQSSDLIPDRVMTFIFGMSDNTSDDHYTSLINLLLEKLENVNDEIKLSILEPIFNQFRYQGNDAMAIYLAEKVLLDLAKSTDNKFLVKSLSDFKKTAAGMKAHDFNINSMVGENKVNSSLHQLNSHDQYLVVFWSSTCGHCLEELPQLKTFLSGRNDIGVIAFGIEDDDSTWSKEIENYPGFIHVLGLNKWDNEIVEKYSVNMTPSYFLLNKDKIITAKPNDVHELKKILQ